MSSLVCGLRPTVIVCVACASSFSVLLGYDIGIMSSAKRLIADDFSLDEGQVSVLVGILNIVSGLGGALSGRLADSMGRRPTAACACIITLGGALLMSMAPGYGALLAGRTITGVGVGFCFHVAPLYLAEISPKGIRGKLTSFFDLFINVGILLGFIVGWALTPAAVTAGGPSMEEHQHTSMEEHQHAISAWRVMLGLGALPPLLILLSLGWLPESPRFLVASGRDAEARAVLHRIYAADEAEQLIASLGEERRQTKPLPLCAGMRRVFLPARGAPRAMILAGMGCAFFQQATGVEAAVYYTPETLEAAGIHDENMLQLATVGVGVVKVAFIVLAACLIERVGRVRLLLVSTALIGFAQLLLGLSFSIGTRQVGL